MGVVRDVVARLVVAAAAIRMTPTDLIPNSSPPAKGDSTPT